MEAAGLGRLTSSGFSINAPKPLPKTLFFPIVTVKNSISYYFILIIHFGHIVPLQQLTSQIQIVGCTL